MLEKPVVVKTGDLFIVQERINALDLASNNSNQNYPRLRIYFLTPHGWRLVSEGYVCLLQASSLSLLMKLL